MVTRPLPEPLLALAPLRLANRRRERYLCDDLCVLLEQLAEPDQTLLRHLYVALGELLQTITDQATDEVYKWQEVGQWIERHHLDTLFDEVRKLGLASHALGASEALSKAMHDVRGGAMSALLGRLQLFARLAQDEKNLQTIFVLVRDHLKIMRSAVIGLDEPRREADKKPKSHDIRLILEKWHESTVGPKWQQRPVRMWVDCRYEGALTECCLESAAVDRIFYNLASNACRHSAGERLEMVIFPVPEPPGDCLRFVLSNEVGEEDAAYLHAMLNHDADGTASARDAGLRVLFEPEVSSTGSGFGLTVVADFVAGAFGLRDRTEAMRNGYVGAVLEGQTFRTWFHWPIANDKLEPKLDDFHRPNESLSEP